MNKFACYHKPTKCWVFFRENKQHVPMICLCSKNDATTFNNKKEANEVLMKASFNNSENYGAENFLEFQIKKPTIHCFRKNVVCS